MCAAIAVFTCRPNSHPFDERQISLTENIKIGRSVARARPLPNNAIFDCKVLSRNHALMWFENDKFYLQDTKSSNGTFVNNERLSKGSEESSPHEIFSGDVIQFGVDVMENSRKVTHGCIIATVTLYHPNGQEHKPSSQRGLTLPHSPSSPVSSQELYELAQFLQEALHREQMLENKLATLQRLVTNTQEISETGWQALIDEDRLLSRLELLESQLQAYSKNATEEALRLEIHALQDDKSTYEMTAKESLRRVLQEKLEAVHKLSELEASLSNTQDECGYLKESSEKSQIELQELAKKHEQQLELIGELNNKLNDAELLQQEISKKAEVEKQQLEEKVEDMSKQEAVLTARLESVQAENDFTNKQLASVKARLQTTQETLKKLEDDGTVKDITEEQVKEVSEKMESEKVIRDLQMKISEEKDENERIINNLKHHIKRLETDLVFKQVMHEKMKAMTEVGSDVTNGNQEVAEQIEVDTLTLQGESNATEVKRYKDLLTELRDEHEKTLGELCQTKAELDTAVHASNLSKENIDQLKEQLKTAELQVKEQAELVADFNEKRAKAEIVESELRKQLKSLAEQLVSTQQAAKKSHNEAENQRSKVAALSRELDVERRERQKRAEDAKNANQELQTQTEHNRAEFASLKEECSNLRRRIQAIENEVRLSRKENRVMADFGKLQESYSALDALKCKLEMKATSIEKGAAEAATISSDVDAQFVAARQEIEQLKGQCEASNAEVEHLKEEMSLMQSEYEDLSYNCRTVSMVSMVPLIMLLLGTIIAWYPLLSTVTATQSP